nr:hypothetical protein [Tanacetum cinerariifolium]
MCDLLDDNNFFIFDDVDVRISLVSKMPFRKKSRDYMNGLDVAFRKSTCFVRNEDGVDFLTNDHSSNLYTIALNEVASNSSTCLLAKASSSQSWLWHQRLSHLNFATINNLVKNNLVQGLPKMKFKKYHLCFACEQGKIHRKHHKSKTAFASNKLLYLLHMDLCGPMRVESINGKRYVLVVVDDYSRSWNLQQRMLKLQSTRKFFMRIPSSNTQSISNNMVPNVDEASTSHNVFNERLEDAYFDASTLFHDPSNVHTFYQPYPHEKNSIEPANVAEALKDADWVSAMQEELDQFARLKIIDSRCSKHMTGNRALLTNFVEKFLGTIRFSNNDFTVIAGYENVVIGSMTIKKVYYVEGLGHNLFSVVKFCDKGLEVAFRKSTCFVRNEDGVDLLTAFILKEEYVGQPPCFVSKQYPDHVYALDKALYVPTPMVEQAKLKLDLVGKPVDHTDYRSMIGSLMYVTSSRPDIMFATCMCARYQANPNEHHMSAVKRIFRYLKGTINLGLWYSKDSGFDLAAYSDADHVGCHLDRKNADHAGCHLDRKTESKYIAVSSCCAQVLWMRTQLTDYGFFYDKVPIYCDSKSAIAISCNPQNCVSISTAESEYVAVSGCCAQVL